MKHLLLISGAVALGIAGPALAKPGMGHGNPHAAGIGNPHGIGFGARPTGPVGYGAGGCPPGLAKKTPPCVPPGIARQQFGIGDQIPTSLGSLLAYDALSHSMRTRYSRSLDPRSRYLSTNGYLYSVNPRTRTVQKVIRTR